MPNFKSEDNKENVWPEHPLHFYKKEKDSNCSICLNEGIVCGHGSIYLDTCDLCKNREKICIEKPNGQKEWHDSRKSFNEDNHIMGKYND